MKFLIAVLMAVWLSSCGPKPQPTTAGPPAPAPEQAAPRAFPEDYRIRIISWLRMNADNPDDVRILSIEPPQLKALEKPVPDKNLKKGELLWESTVVTQGHKGDPPGPMYHRFYFKDGVIQSVDLK
jgi:hypothetical protein